VTDSGEPSVTLHATAVDEAYCPECGHSYSLDHEFCPTDGAKLVVLRARPDMFIGRVFDDRYEVRAPLGYGGMGTVYRGWQRSVDREVAIKVIHPKLATDLVAVKRFLREARLSSRLNQPNIINVYDFGQTDDGVLFLVMELLHGHTLGKELEATSVLPVRRITTIALQLCDALEAAHNHGIIHRDLKPGNIVILDEPPGRDLIKVLDFGLAKSLVADNSRVTHTSVMLGTPLYMPPEQIDGREAEPRSDLYAFGCILHHMATGAPPFVRDHVGAILQAHRHDPVPPMPESVPAPLRAIIERMLQKDAAARPASAAEVRDAMQMIAESGLRASSGMRLPSLAIPAPPPPSVARFAMPSRPPSGAVPPRRRSVLAIAIGLVATLSIASAIYLAQRDHRESEPVVTSTPLSGSAPVAIAVDAKIADVAIPDAAIDAAIEAIIPIDAAIATSVPIDAPKHRVPTGRPRLRDAGGELPDLPFTH